MGIKRITAQDCLPFIKGQGDTIGYTDGSEEAKILNQFSTIVPISIDGKYLKNNDAESKLAYNPFESQPFRKKDGTFQRVWQAGRYIGTTQINGCTIEITPRFGNEWLEYILMDLFHFRLTKSESKNDKGKWNELMRRILWHLWVGKFTTANQYGLPRKTVKHTCQGIQIKGHLNTRKSIIPLLKKNQVVSDYREKEMDDTICRIIYKAYSILARRDMRLSILPPQIQESINNLYSLYQGHPISVTANDYQSISYKSIYQCWKPLVDFSWQIIQQDSLCRQNNAKGEGFSLFLDMAEIWESFLRKKLGEAFQKDGWRVLSVEECNQRIYEGKFYEREIIPDIILQKDNDYMVFDAKYKRMRGVKANVNNSDVDRADLFQIHTYIQYVQHSLGNVVIGGLLYPISRKDYNDDGTQYEYSESGVIDPIMYHADNLFGLNGKENIPFIVDGIYFSETDNTDNREKMDKNVQAMIERIQNVLKTNGKN